MKKPTESALGPLSDTAVIRFTLDRVRKLEGIHPDSAALSQSVRRIFSSRTVDRVDVEELDFRQPWKI